MNNENREVSYSAIFAAIFFWVLSVAWMIIIFFFSGESGLESSSRSAEIVKFLKSLSIFPFMTETIVRKGAHVLEYAVLTFLGFMAVRYTNMISPQTSYSQTPVKIIKSDNEMYITISLWMSAVYAAIDEYHQLFITGRSGSIYDFLIDMCGAVFVLVIIRLVFTINLKRHGMTEVRYD